MIFIYFIAGCSPEHTANLVAWNGFSTVTSTDPAVKFGVVAYGYNNAEGYGFPAGLRLGNDATPGTNYI